MFSSLLVPLAAAACALAAASADQIAALKSAATQNDRINILDNDKDVSEASILKMHTDADDIHHGPVYVQLFQRDACYC